MTYPAERSATSVTDILDYIHAHYYQRSEYSSQTSSHWRKFGELQSLEKRDGQYVLSGGGFGDYVAASKMHALRNIPTRLYLREMVKGCKPGNVRAAKELAKRAGRIFSYDTARMLMTSEFLEKHIGRLDGKRIAIIGDGYGTLGSLIKAINPGARIVYINLGRTLAFDVFYSNMAAPNLQHRLRSKRAETDEDNADFTYIEAEKVFEIEPQAEVFVNIASMQEMDPDVIRSYFDLIRKQRDDVFFYCCNRIEKSLPDGKITRFFDYGWKHSDQVLVDELCPWYQEAPLNRPPFRFRFDGPIHHRLVRIPRTG